MNRPYAQCSSEELCQLYNECSRQFQAFCDKHLALDMSRGKPSPQQTELSRGLLATLCEPGELSDAGVAADNYGCPDGLPHCRALAAQILGCDVGNTIVCGSSSLQLMYNCVAESFIHGLSSQKPLCQQESCRWLCPAPGYDRHFAITESFGFINEAIPMRNGGLDIELICKRVESDPTVKGIWLNPKYQNPLGFTLRDDDVLALARLRPAAPDFRIYWDNAYALHTFGDTDTPLLNIFDAISQVNGVVHVFAFGSFAKITFPSSAIAYMAAHTVDMQQLRGAFNVQRVSPEKLSQLAHVRYFTSLDDVYAHMKKHAALLKPRFDMVEHTLSSQLGGLGIAEWTHPTGGYFVGLTVMEGCARKVVETMQQAGVTLTAAGACWPYGNDPFDATIRLAPTYPPLDDLACALDILCCVVKLVSLQALMERASNPV